jgi:hypothetical protein
MGFDGIIWGIIIGVVYTSRKPSGYGVRSLCGVWYLCGVWHQIAVWFPVWNKQSSGYGVRSLYGIIVGVVYTGRKSSPTLLVPDWGYRPIKGVEPTGRKSSADAARLP